MIEPPTTTLQVTGDAALDLWNATREGETVASLEYENGKTVAARVISEEPGFANGEPIVEAKLQEVKERPSGK